VSKNKFRVFEMIFTCFPLQIALALKHWNLIKLTAGFVIAHLGNSLTKF
jgi:hypothetical protein